MEQILNWRKGLFDSNYQVFNDGLLRFSMNFASLKNAAVVTTQKGIYLLKSEGFSNPETKVVNNQNEVIAKITYDWLGFKAKVVLNTGEQLDWSFQNSWISRWSLNNHSDKQILFNSSTGNGLIHTNVDDDILILIGLFIREYYSRVIFVFALIILLPIFLRGAF
jgi:hypothetical protein